MLGYDSIRHHGGPFLGVGVVHLAMRGSHGMKRGGWSGRVGMRGQCGCTVSSPHTVESQGIDSL